MNQLLLGNRLICFFDILGFSKMLETRDTLSLLEDVNKFINLVKAEHYGEIGLKNTLNSNFDKSFIAFDSILLVSHPIDDPANISKFVLSCISLIQKAGISGFFLRGAIELDEVFYSEKNNVILSKAQPILLKCEKNQEWVGCGITNKAMEVIKPILIPDFEKTTTSAVVRYEIPCKENVGLEYALNWPTTLLREYSVAMLDSLIEPKKTNTVNFYNNRCETPGYAIVHQHKDLKCVVQVVMTKLNYYILLVGTDLKPLPATSVDGELIDSLNGLKFY